MVAFLFKNQGCASDLFHFVAFCRLKCSVVVFFFSAVLVLRAAPRRLKTRRTEWKMWPMRRWTCCGICGKPEGYARWSTTIFLKSFYIRRWLNRACCFIIDALLLIPSPLPSLSVSITVAGLWAAQFGHLGAGMSRFIMQSNGWKTKIPYHSIFIIERLLVFLQNVWSRKENMYDGCRKNLKITRI